jgi:hypothetical protein
MKYIRYGLILAAVALTIIAKVYWLPNQEEPGQSYRPISPQPADYAEYNLELFGADGDEAIAVYTATYIPRGRESNGRYFVKLLDGERRDLAYSYTVLHLRPEKLAEGHYIIFSSVYLEDSEERRERSAPSVTTGLPAFDPLVGAGYLAFDSRRMQGELKLVITYAVDLGSDDAYGPAFAEVAIRGAENNR